jgi:hypothetical protein
MRQRRLGVQRECEIRDLDRLGAVERGGQLPRAIDQSGPGWSLQDADFDFPSLPVPGRFAPHDCH